MISAGRCKAKRTPRQKSGALACQDSGQNTATSADRFRLVMRGTTVGGVLSCDRYFRSAYFPIAIPFQCREQHLVTQILPDKLTRPSDVDRASGLC